LKIFTDRSLKDERVGCAIVTPENTIKNQMRSQTTIFSAKREAIIKAISISKRKGATVIATQYNDGSYRCEMDKKPKVETNKGALTKKKEGSN
jgi:phosphopantetheinyl transferase (holo-ACP synthase)